MGFGTIRHRLRNDFQLAIITLLGLIALLGITPFALLRAANGQWLSFAVDVGIESGILLSVLYAWLTSDTRRPSVVLAYFIGVMSVIAVHVLGIAGAYWLYPALIANFFLTDRRHAFVIALSALLALILTDGLFRSPSESASYSVTLIVSALLAYAFAYRTSVQREQLEVLASKDALTGAYNRRELLVELERTQKAFAREGSAFGLLILDLDHFKRVNDRHGHIEGDNVLIRFAQLLQQSVRASDRVFRYGGEEFVVVAKPASCAGLAAMAENLRGAAERTLAVSGKPLTVSVGGAILMPGESTDSWFSRADTALYIAKNSGRNQVVIDPAQ